MHCRAARCTASVWGELRGGKRSGGEGGTPNKQQERTCKKMYSVVGLRYCAPSAIMTCSTIAHDLVVVANVVDPTPKLGRPHSFVLQPHSTCLCSLRGSP